jgi:hypothetical protein
MIKGVIAASTNADYFYPLFESCDLRWNQTVPALVLGTNVSRLIQIVLHKNKG